MAMDLDKIIDTYSENPHNSPAAEAAEPLVEMPSARTMADRLWNQMEDDIASLSQQLPPIPTATIVHTNAQAPIHATIVHTDLITTDNDVVISAIDQNLSPETIAHDGFAPTEEATIVHEQSDEINSRTIVHEQADEINSRTIAHEQADETNLGTIVHKISSSADQLLNNVDGSEQSVEFKKVSLTEGESPAVNETSSSASAGLDDDKSDQMTTDFKMSEAEFDHADEMELTDETFELRSSQQLPPVLSESHPELLDKQLVEDLAAIPNKMAFKIGEVADLADVKQYVLRYWESEFEALRPKKSRQNQRMYSRRDVENVLMIKKLLYRDRFSIEGARKALKGMKSQLKDNKQWEQVADRFDVAIEQVESLKFEIQKIRQLFV